MSTNTANLSGFTSPTSIHGNNYDDIISCDRPPLPAGHPPLSRSSRAAQFAPFAALSGYQDLINTAEADSTYRNSEIIFDDISEASDF